MTVTFTVCIKIGSQFEQKSEEVLLLQLVIARAYISNAS